MRAHHDLIAIFFLGDPANDFTGRSSVDKMLYLNACYTRLNLGKRLSRFVVGLTSRVDPCPSRLGM
jgi:hypothetical protein